MTSRTAPADLRRTVVGVTISSFGIAALLGIAVLLGAGDFGDTGLQVMSSTLLVGCASVVTLCCLVVVGGRFDLFGVLGFLLTLGTTSLGLLLVWQGDSDSLGENLGETFAVAVTACLTVAQICLLLGLAGRRRGLAPAMWTTVALAVVVAGMVGALIYGADPSEDFARALGVIGILDVLGTVVTIALGVFGGSDDQIGSEAGALSVTIAPPTASRLCERARRTGAPWRSWWPRPSPATSTYRPSDRCGHRDPDGPRRHARAGASPARGRRARR